MSLNRSEANQIIDGAVEKPQFFRVSVNSAVCDAGGRLIALKTMDGSIADASFASGACLDRGQ